MRAHLNAIIIAVAALGVASAPLSVAEAAGKKRHRVYVCEKSRAAANKGTVVGGVSGAVLGGAVAGNGGASPKEGSGCDEFRIDLSGAGAAG